MCLRFANFNKGDSGNHNSVFCTDLQQPCTPLVFINEDSSLLGIGPIDRDPLSSRGVSRVPGAWGLRGSEKWNMFLQRKAGCARAFEINYPLQC